ncbi:CPBP family intramembrane glutamic endopeptidase [Marinovum sp.]|uniref:CPBP family intramembrane glutamic endopeptidase n=1 Tax=Marinovum sp. TaxID=2024839 RepID=UPI003A9355B8
MTIPPFLALTFAISLAGFACIYLIPAARSPESLTGLPFWLLMVWGPSLAAILLSLRDGQLADLLGRMIRVSSVPLSVWGLVLAPMVLILLLRPFAPGGALPLGVGAVALMVAFNLILGPLGEELGWRGVLQTRLGAQMGWLEAALLTGVIWAAWHLPLWTIESPHAAISLPLFAGHVMLYSVIIGAAHTLSGGSLLPAILLHLSFNLAANLAVFAGFRNPDAWFWASLAPYGLLALASIVLVYARTGESGLRWLSL